MEASVLCVASRSSSGASVVFRPCAGSGED
jgi:hypothetical protein